MSKIVKTVIVVAIAVAVVVFAPQIAAILASVAGSIGVTVTAAALTSTLIGMGLSLALTATMSLFRKTPSMSQSMVDRLNTSVVPSAARKIIFGTTAGGQDVRFFEGEIDLPSTKKDGYVQAIALASHRINALKEWYLETELVWANGAFVAKRNGFASNNPFRVVTEGKPGNGFPIGSGRFWNASATFTGCAYYVPFWKLDDEVWESGIPQRVTAVVEGCPLYDPRRDSTRGGSGSHRLDNQDSWAFRDGSVEIGRNPALALITYLIGWRINGQLAWGMGIPANRIDFDNFRAYANLCEERVATLSGSTVQRYTADGIFSTTDSHDTVINALTAAMGSCKLTDRGGSYNIVGGYDDTAGPKVSFTADDLVAPANGSSPYVWNPAPASRERFNIVRGRFADPANLYQLTDWGDPIVQPPLADGVPRTLSLDLGAVSRAETCQRIAKQFLLREYLCPGMFTATFGPKAFAVEIGSVITLSLPAEGWNNKLFRVMDQAETHDLFFQMTLREEDPAIYAWDREEKPLPVSIRPQGYDASATILPANLALTSASYAGANGINVSEVNVNWTPELSGRVSGIQIQSRPQGSVAWSEQAALFDPKIGTFTFTSNAPGITVEVRARFRMSNAVYSAWVMTNVATAPVLINYDIIVDTPSKLGDINPAEGGKLDGIAPGATVGAPSGTYVGDRKADEVVLQLTTNGTNALYATALGTTNQATIDAIKNLQDGSALTAQIKSLTNKVENPDQNAIQTLDMLGAVQPDGNGGLVFVVGQKTAFGSPGKLLGQTIDTIQSQVNGHEASITSIKDIVTTPAGASELRAMTTLNADGVITGTVNTLTGGRSNYAVLADEFRIVSKGSGGIAYTPFSVIDGVVTMLDVQVTKLRAGSVTITSLAPGLSRSPRFTSGDVMIPASETTLIETPLFNVGYNDAAAGSAASNGSALAIVNFTHDGTTQVDTGANIRVYVDSGSGYQLIRTGLSGISTSSGNTVWSLKYSESIAITAPGQARVRITGQGTGLGNSSRNSGTYARSIEINVLSIGR